MDRSPPTNISNIKEMGRKKKQDNFAEADKDNVDKDSRKHKGSRRSRSRSRSRHRRNMIDNIDLCRSRGNEEELKKWSTEYMEHYRSGAVASGRRDYASKPQGYKAMLAYARANPGKESQRLAEDETWVANERKHSSNQACR